MRLKDLPIEMQQKYAGQIDVDGMIRVQYYPEDLAYALGMDDTKIAEVYVESVNNVPVLRIVAVPIDKKQDFKTMRIAPRSQTKGTTRRKTTPMRLEGPGPVTRAPNLDNDKPYGAADKLIGMGKKWIKNNKKPQFMEDAGF